ncbi:MAG: FtsX-like permease family protein [Chloroflexi bacterium]|nr:FtsX-like permease family protein [Chloroflexota bacterium]
MRALAGLVLRRLRSSGPAMLIVAVGMWVSVALVTAVPLFAAGFSDALLRREIEHARLPLASSVIVRHTEGRTRQPAMGREGYQRASAVFGTQLADRVGLPERQQVSYLESDRMPVEAFASTGEPLRPSSFIFGYLATMTGMADNVELLEGRLPADPVRTAQGASGARFALLEGMMSSRAMDDHGLLLGDHIELTHSDARATGSLVVRVEIVGRFVPTDPDSIYWFKEPGDFDQGAVIVDRDAFVSGLLVLRPSLYGEAAWYSNFDPDAIRAANYQRIIGGLRQLDPLAGTVAPNARVETRLDRILVAADQQRATVELTLFVLSAPVVGLVLYFMALSTGMVVDGQRAEIAVLKSRGASTRQVVAVYLLETLPLAGLAIAVGPFLGMGIAQAMGKTLGFLEFTNRADLRLELTAGHYGLAMATASLGILAILAPVVGAARRSIVTHRQQVARARRGPFYQRFFLDLGLLGLALYGYATLRSWDALPDLGPEAEPFSRTLLVLIPIVFILASALVFLRLIPWIVRCLTWAASRMGGVVLFLGLRQMGRRTGPFTGLMILLMLTFATGTFGASMAATINRNLEDSAYYQIGADALFEEYGEFDDSQGIWHMPPIEGHLDASHGGAAAVDRAARLWSDDAVVRLSGGPLAYSRPVTLYGVDPGPFAQTVAWRRDFAPASLEALMNAMITDDRALLVDRLLLAELPDLQVGDPVNVDIGEDALGFFVAGVIDTFPTHFSNDGFFVVADLGRLERSLGESPWNVLARLRPDVGAEELVGGLRELGFRVIKAFDARELLASARNDAMRIGTFGILTAGFVVSVLLTVASLAAYALISFRRQLPEFGILRAMGTARRQMVALIVFEHGFLVVLGTAAGTALGIVTGALFTPFMQLQGERLDRAPPFVAVTAWDDLGKLFAVLGIALALVLAVTMRRLWGIRTHAAIKFGDE